MKQKLVATAVAAALAAAAGSAFALTPGNFDPATIPQVYMSGATAQNGGIANVMRLLCVDGTLDAYTTTSQVAYVCTVRTGSTLGAAYDGTAIAIHKEYSGGSGLGIDNLINGITLNFVNLAPIVAGQTVCTVDTVSSVGAQGLLGAEQVWNCPGTQVVAQTPQVGFSDVDPAVFGKTVTGTAGTITVNSPNQLTFGVAVTVPLRNALQAEQGLTVGSDLAVDTPSLANAEVQRMFQQTKASTNTGATFGLTGDANRVYAVRRGATSGTQKTAEVYFFNANVVQPSFAINQFASPTSGYNSVVASDAGCGTATSAPASTGMVFAGSSNEQVVNCLNRHAAGGRYAVASLTMEFNAFNPVAASTSASIDTNYPTGFRFVKLNGYLPTVENMVRGAYTYYSEQVVTGLNTLAGTPLAVMNGMIAELGNAGNVTTINSTFTRWNDLPVGYQTSGLVKPGSAVAANCRGKFAALGTTPDTDPVNFITKNNSGSNAQNAVPAGVATCPRRF
jgi:hypothetical protein